MSLFSRIAVATRVLFTGQRQSRAFAAAQAGRLYSDWIAGATAADTEIRSNIRRLIDRSRSLERDNDYQRGFLQKCETNIVGAIRYDLRMECGDKGWVKNDVGQKVWQFIPDRVASSQIEDAFYEWAKKGTCTVCGKYSWRMFKRLAVRSVPRDGNFIVRKIRGPAARNRFGFALQIWEIDHLDIYRFEKLRDGGEIRFGIEYDPMKRPVAYWLMADHPGDFNGNGGSYKSTRFSADEIYHVFLPERAEQSIGFPWVVSAITRLRQLGAFEEAATIAARLGASSSIFFETDDGEWVGDTMPDGRAIMDVEPGTATSLPKGWKPSPYTPTYPNIQTGDFRKAMLRGVGTALGMSYNTLGNDLESVNFSSARVGLFDEREVWKLHQMFFDEELFELIFMDWLESSILSGAVTLPMAKFAKFNRPRFKARRWPFIDPLKEMEAAKVAIALRVSSRRSIIEEGGGDVEDVFHDNVDDEKLADDLGLDLVPPSLEATPTSSKDSGAALAEEDNSGDGKKIEPS